MEHAQLAVVIVKLIDAIEKRIPEFMKNPIDAQISAGGNVAVCIIDADGCVYGRMFGPDKPKQRRVFKIAWTKASQVHLTGIATGQYEKLVYADKIDTDKFGVPKPDLVGWEGGQPLAIDKETTLSVGFSGFEGKSDLQIVIKALEDIK